MSHDTPPPDPPGSYAWPTGWGNDVGQPGYWGYGKYTFPIDNGQRYAELRVDNSIAAGDAYITQTWITTGDIPAGTHAQQFAAFALPTAGATGVWMEISFDTSPSVSRGEFAGTSTWQTNYFFVDVPVVAHSYTLRIGVNKDPATTTGTRSILIDRCFIWDYGMGFEPGTPEWINWDFEIPADPRANRCLIASPIPLPTLTEQDPMPTTYELYLSQTEDAYPPRAAVFVTIDPNDQVQVNGLTPGANAVLTFTMANCHLPQTVTVLAFDDDLDEGPHTGVISHTSVSADPNYDDLIIRTLTYPIEDNDALAVNVSETEDSTDVTEGGPSDIYYISLGSPPPGGPAVITADPDDQLEVNAAGCGQPAQLTFTTGNWNVLQQVVVSACDDDVLEHGHSGLITHGATGYESVIAPDVNVNISDNEPYCGQAGQQYLTWDVSGSLGQPDCYVNLYDFASFAAAWLNCTDLSDPACEDWKAIAYINPDAAVITTPQYPGTYYHATVPDTLDLAERCRLAVHGLTETTDPGYDYELYWIVDLLASPPAMYHTPDDHVQTKFVQALPLCRTACGSAQNLDIERAILQVYLKMQGPDGLIYLPIPDRPWALNGANPWGGLDYLPTGDYWCSLVTTGRTLGAFCLYALKDPASPWADAANNLVNGFDHVIIEHSDTAYMFLNCTDPDKAVVDYGPPTGLRAAMNAWPAQGLAQAYRTLGNTRARDLALKMMTHIMRDGGVFGPNGEFAANNHFHLHTNCIMAALEVVQATGDQYLLDRATQAYNYALANGNVTLGFFPEWLPSSGTSEICEVADMITCAVKFSQLGIDKWDDADRWVRNQFAECQLTHIEWLTDGSITPIVRTGPVCGGGMMCGYPEYGTTDHVAERVIGTFSGWPSANDFAGGGVFSIMHCCTGNGTRALYYVWKHMLNYDSGTLSVNLLLNRASQWADVDSYIPYSGRVDLHIKENLTLRMRMPEWAESGDITATVNGSPRTLSFDGRYAVVGSVAAEDEVRVEFPLPEVTEVITVAGANYTITRRGNSVIDISPGGTKCPLYQDGERFQTGPVRYLSLERFIPNTEIDW